MNIHAPHLNLARKWRSRTFDQIVGQELSVRVLKNSLYLSQLFPVYLFSGQRGCGKTSLARIFAAAINCDRLVEFQKNPRGLSIPCNTCDSCKAMLEGRHPDFIEIDAASHTGVDNVRMIIDAASLMPILGKKKVYLIDEAHMLSKAAFNAFLKILEEPPMSVHFILATTDAHKIIDTVRSRSFQVLFKPVDSQTLIRHLEHVCKSENVRFDHDGLALIAQESQGSVRDALNLLEQVRFAASIVTAQSVRLALGHMDDDQLIHLVHLVLQGDAKVLLQTLTDYKIERYSASFLWRRIMDIVKYCLWGAIGVDQSEVLNENKHIASLVNYAYANKLYAILQFFYQQEPLFVKTTAQHSFFEMILLQLCQKNKNKNNIGGNQTPQQASASVPASDEGLLLLDDEQEEDEDDDSEEEDEEETLSVAWKRALDEINKLPDPIIRSLFTQAEFTQNSSDSSNYEIAFGQSLALFAENVDQSRALWEPIIKNFFPRAKTISCQFSLATQAKPQAPIRATSVEQRPVEPAMQAPQAAPKPTFTKNSYANKSARTPYIAGTPLDVSDKERWKLTNLVLNYFPGTVRQIQDRQ